MQVVGKTVMISRLERILAILAVVVCVIITFFFWFSISAYQNIWPLPGLYFIEMVALSFISTTIFVRGDPLARFMTWGAAGVISTFSVLGAFSIGFFYLPIALIFALISVTSEMRNKQHIAAHLGIFLIAGTVQLVLMLAAIRLLDPRVFSR
jgi:hypothetical protein